MDHGPRRRIVQKAMSDCLSRIRRYGELPEAEFADAVADLPDLLREAAGLLESPPDDLACRTELPGFDGYALWAEGYDLREGNPVVAGEEEVIWDLIGDPAGLRVLDVGCGTGRHAIPLAARGAHVLGLEPAPPMRERAWDKAQAQGLALDLRGGSLDEVKPELGTFDLVLCCLVLSHVPDLPGAVARLADRVAPGGRLIVSDFHPANLMFGFRTAFTHEGRKYIVPNHLRHVGEYFGAFTDAGLEVTRVLERGNLSGLPGVPAALVMAARSGRL